MTRMHVETTQSKPSDGRPTAAIRGFSLFLLLVALLLPTAAQAGTMPWIIDADTAKKLVDDGATLLDARGKWAYAKGHLDGAVRVAWDDFTHGSQARKGELLDDDSVLEKRLEKLGVQNGRPVVVVDDPKNGWGEAGRIVWMLRTLGHERAAWVDGGHAALAKTGISTTVLPVEARKSSGFDIERTSEFVVGASGVKSSLGKDGVVFVDTREAREYSGKTPYGEDRGGHLPGAKHLWFKDLIGKDGRLKSTAELRKMLSSKGIAPDKRIVAYCTGGVRSGWFTGVLHHIGYANVQNYAGSMWEWSSRDAESHPLEK